MLRRNIELYTGARQFYNVIQTSQTLGTPGVHDTDRTPVSGIDISLSDPENSTAWPWPWTIQQDDQKPNFFITS